MKAKRKGQVIVELLFAVILIFPMFSYMIDIHDQVHANIILMSASREAARWATRHSGLTTGDPNLPIKQAIWRACDYIAESTGDFSRDSCPTDATSHRTPNGVEIRAGWWDESDPLLRPYLPAGPQREVDGKSYRQVPIWVALYWEKDRIVGFPPLNNKVRAKQQATMMMDYY